MKLIKSEDDVKKKIIQPWLKSLGAWQFMPVQQGMGASGIPDHIAAVPIVITPEMVGMRIALFVAPEAKAPDKKHNASDRQKLQMAGIDEAGGITGIISCAEDKDMMYLRICNMLQGDFNAAK